MIYGPFEVWNSSKTLHSEQWTNYANPSPKYELIKLALRFVVVASFKQSNLNCGKGHFGQKFNFF